ncbi:MAG: hypothetical protein M0R21_05420 [Lentimicrobiaceae bacterium]|jgi:protein-S-isoprenylcysteine O-methyltransferase Ste14|nr:hypothetical protein [Lentimicrobiaceae bacterium]
MKQDIISYTLVFLQFTGIGFVFITGPWLAESLAGCIAEGCGLVLILWSVLAMQIGNFHASPSVKNNARLVIKGPYHVIRHPMYLSVLLICGALVADSFTFYRGIIFLLLFIILTIKILYEESLLKKHFIEYRLYMKNTNRLIPWIF